jgi:hypothetical protein
MGWGNGQVEYGAAPIYGGGVVYEDTRAIEELQRQLDKAIRFFEEAFIGARAWKLVAYTVANSKNKNDRSIEELDVLYRQAKTLLTKHVKKNGFSQFYNNDLELIKLEP